MATWVKWTWVQILSAHAESCNLSSQEVETGGSLKLAGQGHLAPVPHLGLRGLESDSFAPIEVSGRRWDIWGSLAALMLLPWSWALFKGPPLSLSS